MQVSFQEVEFWSDTICQLLALAKGLPSATPRVARQSLHSLFMPLHLTWKKQQARLLDFRVFLLDHDLVLHWIVMRAGRR